MAADSGPLEDVTSRERSVEWTKDRVAQLEKLLPRRAEMRSQRYKSCAVVGSSPELLLYEDGKAIDAHDAVFRANLAVTKGFEKYAGRRTAVRVINPVESHSKARKAGGGGDEMIIKNQDPPIIRSPSRELTKFVREGEQAAMGPPAERRNYLARRGVLELCNYMMLASALGEPDGEAGVLAALASNEADNAGGKQGRKKRGKEYKAAAAHGLFNLSHVTAAFRDHAAGRSTTWHPLGDGIPRFSPVHCSTGSVLLTQALLTCDRVRLYGYHSCSCKDKCEEDPSISSRNHYWDKKETPRFGQMMARYEHRARARPRSDPPARMRTRNPCLVRKTRCASWPDDLRAPFLPDMKFYQKLENSCELDFKIARREHCDS